jgi:hypothetical protein
METTLHGWFLFSGGLDENRTSERSERRFGVATELTEAGFENGEVKERKRYPILLAKFLCLL